MCAAVRLQLLCLTQAWLLTAAGSSARCCCCLCVKQSYLLCMGEGMVGTRPWYALCLLLPAACTAVVDRNRSQLCVAARSMLLNGCCCSVVWRRLLSLKVEHVPGSQAYALVYSFGCCGWLRAPCVPLPLLAVRVNCACKPALHTPRLVCGARA